MAAVSRLQSLTNKTPLQNLIHRHLLRPIATPTAAAAAASADPFNIFPQSQPSVHYGLPNPKSSLGGRLYDNNKLSVSNADEFLLNWNFVSALPTFDLFPMELRGSRSTSSKKRPDLEEYIEDDDEDDFDDDDDDDDDDDESKGFADVYGSWDDSDDDEDDYGRRGRGGGSRGGGAYTV